MRGAALFSILLFTACAPVHKPDVSPNDPSSTGNGSSKTDEPQESWGSSETAEQAHIKSNAVSAPTDSVAVATPGIGPTATTSGPGGPHVAAGFGGPSYDHTELEVTLKRAARQVDANCGAATDDDGAATGPWGKTTITVKVGHNGHTKGGTIPAPFDGKPTGRCVVQAFTNLIYPPFAGGDVDLDWPVELKKP